MLDWQRIKKVLVLLTIIFEITIFVFALFLYNVNVKNDVPRAFLYTIIGSFTIQYVAAGVIVGLKIKNKKLVNALLALSSLAIVLIVGLNINFSINTIHIYLSDLFTQGVSDLLATTMNTLNTIDYIVILAYIAAVILVQNLSVGLVERKVDRRVIPIVIILGIISTAHGTSLGKSLQSTDNEINSHYSDLYQQSLTEERQKYNFIQDIAEGRSIYVIELESLNSDNVNESITPYLYSLRNEGVMFKNIQAGSIITIPNQAILFCGLPPYINRQLSFDSFDQYNLQCLPKILKEAGYKTIFIKPYDIGFGNTYNFLRHIGFDEVVGEEIFKKEDPKFPWGFYDDIAFQRYTEYLEQYEDEKVFVFLMVGTINHSPFEYYKHLDDRNLDLQKLDLQENIETDSSWRYLRNPDNFVIDFQNSTKIQDYFLKEYVEETFIPKHGANTHLIITGDHSYPNNKHDNNIYPWQGAYQENFVTTMLYRPPDNLRDELAMIGSNENKFANFEFMDLVLSLAGFETKNRLYRSIFEEDYIPEDKCLMSVQAMGEKKIVVIRFPDKYIINGVQETIHYYDLEYDPEELNPTIYNDATQAGLKLVEECFKETYLD